MKISNYNKEKSNLKNEDLIKIMTIKNLAHQRLKRIPLKVFEINNSFIIGIYQGNISEFDIVIRYKQKLGNEWSRIRTPKHIHWAVDILIKMHEDREKTKEFLDLLINIWNNTLPIKNEKDKERFLNIENLLEFNKNEIEYYQELSKKGEYSIKFLIMLAKLLMIQEKTNLESAFMFKKLLEALKQGKDIFSIVSVATHNRK